MRRERASTGVSMAGSVACAWNCCQGCRNLALKKSLPGLGPSGTVTGQEEITLEKTPHHRDAGRGESHPVAPPPPLEGLEPERSRRAHRRLRVPDELVRD